jgi:hypothetical protein
MLTKVASGYWKITDPQNGYTAISGDALTRLDLDDLYDEYGFLNSLLVHLNARGMRVADVAVPAVYGEESSTIRYSRFVPSLSMLLLTCFWWRLKTKYVVFDFHPLVLFYALGVLGLAGGAAGLAGSLVGVGLPLVASGVPPPELSLVAASVWFLVGLVGGLSLATGMLLDMRESTGLERLRYDRADADDGLTVRDVTDRRDLQ